MTTARETFEILVSDGSEAKNATPKWITVDASDCMISGVAWADGDTIEDAIERFIAEGELPAGARLAQIVQMANPYPWQPPGYRFRWYGTV